VESPRALAGGAATQHKDMNVQMFTASQKPCWHPSIDRRTRRSSRDGICRSGPPRDGCVGAHSPCRSAVLERFRGDRETPGHGRSIARAVGSRRSRSCAQLLSRHLGVEGHVRTEEYGYVIETSNGVAFTLFRGQPPADVGEFHLGVALPDGRAVQGARRQFRSIGLVKHSWCEEPGLTSVKVVDPDGYVVEVFAENDA
jgi:hypothetical protein